MDRVENDKYKDPNLHKVIMTFLTEPTEFLIEQLKKEVHDTEDVNHLFENRSDRLFEKPDYSSEGIATSEFSYMIQIHQN